jgi:hypothetical protein
MPDGAYGEHLGDRVHQATGMISAQAECDLTEALALLIVRAAELGQTLETTALDVIDGVIRFDDPDRPGQGR